mmetsp:Transcript_32101/g.57482  ORF Transcript_32101/g.57482 Transcript_32101/m.57482 type:complete len:425 (+) Transcript_32101:258-1532(+)
MLRMPRSDAFSLNAANQWWLSYTHAHLQEMDASSFQPHATLWLRATTHATTGSTYYNLLLYLLHLGLLLVIRRDAAAIRRCRTAICRRLLLIRGGDLAINSGLPVRDAAVEVREGDLGHLGKQVSERLIRRSHAILQKSHLTLGHVDLPTDATRRLRNAQLPLLVTLAVKLLHDTEGPGPREWARLGWVGNVSAVHKHRERAHPVQMPPLAHVRSQHGYVVLKLSQQARVDRHVGGQHQLDERLTQEPVVLVVEVAGKVAVRLLEKLKGVAKVHVLVDTLIVINLCFLRLGVDQKVIIQAGMTDVVRDGCEDNGKMFHGGELAPHRLVGQENRQGLSHIRGVNVVMVRVLCSVRQFYSLHKVPEFIHVQVELAGKAKVVDNLGGYHFQGVTVRQLREGKYVEIVPAVELVHHSLKLRGRHLGAP